MRTFSKTLRTIHTFSVQDGFYIDLPQAERLARILCGTLQLDDGQYEEVKNSLVGTATHWAFGTQASGTSADFYDEAHWAVADLRVVEDVKNWLYFDECSDRYFIVVSLGSGRSAVLRKVVRKEGASGAGDSTVGLCVTMTRG